MFSLFTPHNLQLPAPTLREECHRVRGAPQLCSTSASETLPCSNHGQNTMLVLGKLLRWCPRKLHAEEVSMATHKVVAHNLQTRFKGCTRKSSSRLRFWMSSVLSWLWLLMANANSANLVNLSRNELKTAFATATSAVSLHTNRMIAQWCTMATRTSRPGGENSHIEQNLLATE